ncbi:restriction endonuclease subunit S [Bifidobacterium sp. ESL0775]|uniref:restriction endonuclease subunit S n=1 Tax=Bifidobacterium sp. ESL0775 TaxID=2983230 RepID=UPI0023F881AD|nr:restriction endonuclease subunit S [Bifidobacterium sp. ESL0775]WEV68915.1 restriction endonuclease subunit S [Bifidobacterium sp. ESL0775]
MSEQQKDRKLVPQLRFKGFNDPWEQRKLGSCLNLLKDGTHGTHQEADGPYLLSAKNIKNGKVIFDKSDRHISFDDYNQIFHNYELLPNDVLLTIVGSIGETAQVPEDIPPIAFQRSVAVLRGKNNLLNSYLLDYLRTENVQNQLRQFTSISAQPGIYLADLAEIKIAVPASDEQRRISAFFKTLDDLIAACERKVELLKKRKRYYLQQIFSQRLRFKGFTQPWQERKLKEVALIVMGQSPKGENYTLNHDDPILVQGNADLVNGWVKPRIHTKEVTKEAMPGDLIFTVRAPVGEVGKTSYKVVLGRGVAAIRGNDFIFQVLLNARNEKLWSRISSGSTFDSISSTELENFTFFLPEYNEQVAIGLFLQELDAISSLNDRKINLYQYVKKFYLQALFR